MERYFRPGRIFALTDAGGTFEVREMIGRGASCAVYRAYFCDPHGIRTEHLLKEYNPKGADLYRDEEGVLHPGCPEAAERFQSGLIQFQDGFSLQLRIRQECPELTNFVSNVERIYTGNGTKYVSMPWFQGRSYSQLREKDLFELLRRIKAITRAVGLYHANGFLHLDIKPENIYILPETTELVMLFDFDSVVRKADLSNAAGLSCTKTWAAPEQLLPDHRRKICEATDLYAIGRILFHQLMGRHPVREECRSFSVYQYDLSSDLLRDVNPRVFPLLSQIFSHTICTDVSKRYQSAEELIGKLDELLPLADPKAPYLIETLPPALSSFVGRREEMREMHRRLQEQSKLFLSGIGGIGKSGLAKQYAQQFREVYDAVVFARCTGTLEGMFADDENIPIAHVSLYAGETLPQYSRRKRDFWRSLCTERTLLIVDNLNDVEDPLLPELLKMNCRVLITTRADASQLGQPQLTVNALAVPGEIETVFQNSCRQELAEEDRPAVQEMIRLVDGHTMAVDLLAKQMRAAGLTPAEMLERLETRGISGSGREKIRSGKDGDFSRRDAFDHVRVLFQVAGLSADQQLVLMNMSLLPYTGIAKRRMREWCGWEDYEALNQLVETGWVKEDPDGIISLHPLVAEVAVAHLRGAPQACEIFLKNIRDYLKQDRIALPPEQKWADAALMHAIGSNICRCGLRDRMAVFLLDRIALELSGYGRLDDCASFCRYALQHIEKLYGPNSAVTAQEWNTLGKFYFDKGDYAESEACDLKAFEIRKNLPKASPLALAQSLVNLGAVCLVQKRLKEAESYLQQGLKRYQELAKTDHKDIALALKNLGELYLDKGNLSAAESCYLESLHMYERLFGENHPAVARAFMGLARFYLRNRNWEQAKEAYQRASAIFKSTYGDHHANTASAEIGLGVAFECMGDLGQAEICYQNAIQDLRNLFGETHPETLRAKNNLGTIYAKRDNHAAAEELYLSVLKEYRTIFGEISSRTANVLLELGQLYKSQGDLRKAEHYLVQCMRIFEKLYSGTQQGHPDLARIYQNLGNLKKEKGDFAAAAEYLDKALGIRKRLYGEHHPITVDTMVKLGDLLYAQGNMHEARETWETALDIRRSQCGNDHPDTARILQKLGRMYYENGDLNAADECFRNVYRIYSQSDTGPSGRLINILVDLGNLESWRGENNSALSHYRQAYGMCCSLYGARSKSAASALNRLGIGFRKNGEPSAAEEAYCQALSIYEEIYGKDAQNLSVAAVLHNLGVLYENKRDYAGAKVYYEQALDIRLALLGDHHKATATSWGHYGLACGRLGDFAYGEVCCKKELSALQDLMGSGHIAVAGALHRIGCLYAAWGKREQAEEAFSRALEIRQKKLGEMNPDTVKTREELENLRR